MNIKRPVRLFLFSIIIGIIILFGGIRLIDKLILISLGLFLCFVLFINKNIKYKTLIIILFFVFLGAMRFYVEKSFFDKININIDALNRKKQNITATIHSKGKSANSYYFILDDVEVYDTKFFRMRCYYDEKIYKETKIGNKINITGNINKNSKAMNIGQFDSEIYYRSLGESGIIYANDFYVIDNNYDFLRQNIYELREQIIKQIFKIFTNKNAGLFTAMLVGDKSYLDKDQKDLFNENGIAHILAISGLHLSILGLCLFELLRKKFSIKVSSIIVSIVILLYAIFIDASVTTLRAIIMLYVRFISLGVGRSYDSKNVLFLTALVFIIFRPYLIFNSGFQFSYVAVYSLNLDYKYEFKTFVEIRKKILNILYPDEMKTINKIHKIPQVIILTLFLLPITIYNYFQYPLYSILLNLIVIPLMTFVLIFGIIGLLISFINIFFGSLLVGIVHFIFVFYEFICNYINKLPYHSINVGRPSIKSIIIYYIILFVIYILMNYYLAIKNKNIINIKNKYLKKILFNIKIIIKKINYVYIFFISLVLITFSIFLMSYHNINGVNIEMLYIGQGDSLIIRNDNKVITVDGGSNSSQSNGKYILEPNLMAKSIDKIDVAFITHSDADHTNCIEYLLKEDNIKIDTLVLPIFAKTDNTYDKLISLCKKREVIIQYMKRFDIMTVDDDISFLCLSPSESYIEAKKDVNEQSLVLKMNYKNKSLLLTGDIGKETETKLLNDEKISNILGSNILKVAHHGSKNSSTKPFLDKVSAQYAIVSYGIGNKYGHPNDKIIENLKLADVNVYETGEKGEIDININEDKIRIKTFIK